MTEREWLTSDDPVEMLRSLQGRASDRKLRLFVVACGCLIDPPSPDLLPIWATAERFADDPAALDEVRQYWLQPGEDAKLSWPERPFEWATEFAADCRKGEAGDDDVYEGYPPAPALPPILREVFGNPFRPVAAEPRWLTPVAVSLARGIYEDRAYDHLPYLADALEEAGCADDDLLGHLRSAGPHVRGCWALDLILGKG